MAHLDYLSLHWLRGHGTTHVLWERRVPAYRDNGGFLSSPLRNIQNTLRRLEKLQNETSLLLLHVVSVLALYLFWYTEKHNKINIPLLLVEAEKTFYRFTGTLAAVSVKI